MPASESPTHFITGAELDAGRLDLLLGRADDGAFALRCLPARPGEEITQDVRYGDRRRIRDQAENRRHAHTALLELLVSPSAEEG
jgi:ornithine carbamoyltransferase